MVVVLPTSAGDTPGGTPIIFAASEIGNFIALPTSAGDTPGGTPMTFIASTRGMVDGAEGTSSAVSVATTFVPACAWAEGGKEVLAMALSLTSGAVSCATFASRGAEGITTTFTIGNPFTPPKNA